MRSVAAVGAALDSNARTAGRWYEIACDYLDSVGLGLSGVEV